MRLAIGATEAINVCIYLLLSFGMCPMQMEMSTHMCWNSFVVESDACGILLVAVKSY